MFFVGRQGSKRNVINKYLLGSFILTFPICLKDNSTGMYFLGSTLKGLVGLLFTPPMVQSLLMVSANICCVSKQQKQKPCNNSSGFFSTFLGLYLIY